MSPPLLTRIPAWRAALARTPAPLAPSPRSPRTSANSQTPRNAKAPCARLGRRELFHMQIDKTDDPQGPTEPLKQQLFQLLEQMQERKQLVTANAGMQRKAVEKILNTPITAIGSYRNIPIANQENRPACAPRRRTEEGARADRAGPLAPGGCREPSTGQRRPALPRAPPAVPSARCGLASGFGMGPGVPRTLWPLTGGRLPAAHPGLDPARPEGRTATPDGPRTRWRWDRRARRDTPDEGCSRRPRDGAGKSSGY